MSEKNSVYNGKTKDGEDISISPITLQDIDSGFIESIKEHFTPIQQEEFQGTMEFYKAICFENQKIPVVDCKEYELVMSGKKIAETGICNIGWWAEEKRIGWCWMDVEDAINAQSAIEALNYLVADKRVVLLETPQNGILPFVGKLPNTVRKINVCSYIPSKPTSQPIGLRPVDTIDSKVYKHNDDVEVTYYVARNQKDEPVGITGRYNFGHYRQIRASWLGWTGVPKIHEGRGIGTMLVLAMIEEAKKLNHQWFCIETYGGAMGEKIYGTANHVYTKLGFTYFDLGNFFEGEPGRKDGMSLRIYVKKVS
jgi:GNAT superfamily N-acetyltransferase